MYKLIPYFPPGVELHEDFIRDINIDTKIPLNPTAHLMLSSVNGENDVTDIKNILAKLFDVDEKQIYDDIQNLLKDFNDRYLLNWKCTSNNKIVELLLNLVFQYKRGYRERLDLNRSGGFQSYLYLLLLFAKKVGLFFFLFMAFCLASGLFIGSDLVKNIIYYYLLIFGGLITSFALHEFMHIYVYWKMTGSNKMGFLAADNLSMNFVRPILDRPLLTATLLGPLTPGIIGVVGLLICYFFTGFSSVKIQTFFLIYSIHLLHLVPVWGDGKKLFKDILMLKYQKPVI